jgi:hypothetical protein
VVLVLGLLGVLVRNLVRLIVDRKHGHPGLALRTKLVFFSSGLVLLPTPGAVLRLDGRHPHDASTPCSGPPWRTRCGRRRRPPGRAGRRCATRRSGRWSEGRPPWRPPGTWRRRAGTACQAQLQALRTEHDLRLAAVVTGPETLDQSGGGGPAPGSPGPARPPAQRCRAASTGGRAPGAPGGGLGWLLVLAAATHLPGEPGDALVVGALGLAGGGPGRSTARVRGGPVPALRRQSATSSASTSP